MTEARADTLVLGAGPAGIGAATMAASCGIDVVLLDEAAIAGGQIYRAIPEEFRRTKNSEANPDLRSGDALRAELARSRVRVLPQRRIWSVAPSFRAYALGPSGPETWHAPTLVVALGTTERIVPFPGWTTPGVIGLAAATVLLKAQQTLPGERVLVSGCGPLVYAVAYGVLKAGGNVVAVLDLTGLTGWLSAAPKLASRPTVAWRGLSWIRAIRAAGVPVLLQHAIRSVEPHEDGLAVVVGPVDGDRRPLSGFERRFHADGVAVGHGLVPAIEVTRMLGVKHGFEPAAGGWVPRHDPGQRTEIPGLYVAGDGTGIEGADPALLKGQIAGLTLARDLGRIDGNTYRRRASPIVRRLRHAARFGQANARLMAMQLGQLETITQETIVCRCEDVSRGEIDAALAAGAREVNEVKAWTRCGMGPCQGRVCGDVIASLVGLHVGGRERAGAWTSRPPLRPIHLNELSATLGARPLDPVQAGRS
jgi:NADPH-dependent 2,4-dienoyl-CoA reductase/sulfur reductase-like enzyme